MTKPRRTNHKKVLIVEDEISLLKALVIKFRRNGFKVLTARNGEEGLKCALKERPDLILLDIIMPKMDGVTMLKKLRKDKKCLTIPVILLTNLGYDKEVEEAIKHGVTDFLVKTNWKIEDVIKKAKEKLCLNCSHS